MSVETTNFVEAVNCGYRFKRNRLELFARFTRKTLLNNSSSESRINLEWFNPLSVKPVTYASTTNSRKEILNVINVFECRSAVNEKLLLLGIE